MTPEQKQVAKAARNRMQLKRQFGLSFQCVEVVLKLATLRAYGKPRASQADVARAMGVHRTVVCRQLKRAEAAGLLVRIGRTYFFRLAALLDAESQAEIARRVAKLKREFVRKCRKVKQKIASVNDRLTHTVEEYLEPVVTRSEALEGLRSTYIPVHLRKFQG